MHGTSLLSTPGQFEPVLLLYVCKNDDKELCFLNYLALGYYYLMLIRHNRVFDVHKSRAIYGNFAVAMMMMSKRGFLHYTVRKTLFRIFAFLRSRLNLKLHFLRPTRWVFSQRIEG